MVANIKNKFFGMLQNKLGKNAICTSVAIKMRNQINGVISAHLNDGIEMDCNGEEWLMRRVASRVQVFVDVGANSGAWTAKFLELSGPNQKRGILFEPSPVAFLLVKANLRRELLNGTVELVQAAVSDARGSLDFYMEDSAGETSSLLQKHSNAKSTKITVDVTTIDEEIARRGIDFIDLLKIDTEGYDFHVLQGANHYLSNNKIGVIQFEYNSPWADAGSTLAAALDFLEKRKYSIYLLKHGGLYTFDHSRYGEFLHYSNFVAIAPNFLEVTPLSLG